MASIQPRNYFTFEQTKFLEDNFVIFDPETKQFYKDFTVLANSKVILLGELHRTKTLHHVENLFLQNFANEKCCLLVEGLPPSQQLKKGDIPYFPDIPKSMVIRGADIRNQDWSQERYREFCHMEQKLIDLEQERSNFTQDTLRRVAAILNRDFLSGITTIHENHLEIEETTYNTIEGVSDDSELKDATFRKSLNDAIDQLKNIVRSPKDVSYNAEMVRSNQGLLKEIMKARHDFDRIIAIWGEGHYIAGQELLDGLATSQINYSVLLFNSQRITEAKEENKWQAEAVKVLTLNLSKEVKRHFSSERKLTVEHEITVFRVPKPSLSFFHPAIQNLMYTEPKKPTITLNSLALHKLLSQNSQLIIPANTTIRIFEIDLVDFYALDDLKDLRNESKMLEDEKIKIARHHICNVFNKMLLFCNRKLKSLSVEGSIEFSCTYKKRKPCLEISSDEPFTLTALLGIMETSASFLFREMKQRGLKGFKIQPECILIFRDIELKEIKEIITQPATILKWFSAKASNNTGVMLRGEAIIKEAEIVDEESSTQGIALTTHQGVSIELQIG